MGALTVSIPIVRYTNEVRARAIAEVTQAAGALSMQLGGR
jgi:DNA-binding IclR family transcriptional regulator